ncbi:MAG: precorrin-2 dehydrogenase/sirohydrochlorin ferrochelatase family protein, partial [Acidimicrobiales bacterium]
MIQTIMVCRTPLYPISLVVSKRSCLVVGGGRVAARKVEGLFRSGADVTVVAPDVVDDIRSLASTAITDSAHGSLNVETRPYRSPEAAGYRLVITATGLSEVDHAVFTDADAAGVWVNSADDVENCTFMLPAVYRDGAVTVAVSTGGASPALAGWLRNQVAEAIDPGIPVVAALLDEVRSMMRSAGRSTESLDWLEIIGSRLLPLIHNGE